MMVCPECMKISSQYQIICLAKNGEENVNIKINLDKTSATLLQEWENSGVCGRIDRRQNWNRDSPTLLISLLIGNHLHGYLFKIYMIIKY